MIESSAPNQSIGEKRWIWIAFFLLALYPFVKFGWVETWGYAGFDYGIFYHAAEDLQAGRSPYSREVFYGETVPTPLAISSVYVYPAFFARLLIPFTLFPPWISRCVFVFLTFTGILLLLRPLFAEILDPDRSVRERWVRFVATVCLLFSWGPLIENLRFGQSNLLALALFCAAWRSAQVQGADKSYRPFLTGLLVGLAAMIKLTPFLIVPFLILTGFWRVLVGVATGAILAILVSGWNETQEYFTRILPIVAGLEDSPRGIALGTIIDRHLPEPLSRVTLIALGLVLLMLVFRNREKFSLPNLILLGAYLPTVFSGLWYHHYLLALLPLLVLVPTRLIELDAVFLAGDPGRAILRGFVILFPLLMGFHYWLPVRKLLAGLEGITPLTGLEIFVLGHIVVFMILLPRMISSDE